MGEVLSKGQHEYRTMNEARVIFGTAALFVSAQKSQHIRKPANLPTNKFTGARQKLHALFTNVNRKSLTV